MPLNKLVTKPAVFLSIICLHILINSSIGYAQTTDQCEEILAKAEEQYKTGNWDSAIKQVLQCLEKKNISENEQGAYRLLGLIYIATEAEKKATEAIRQLLILAPNYKINEEKDPPQLQKIINDVSLSLVPNIRKINPAMAMVNEDGIKIKVTGSNFSFGSIVRFDGHEKFTEYINSEELIVEITPKDLRKVGEHIITVYSPIQDGKLSNAVDFIVNSTSSNKPLKFLLSGVMSVPLGSFAADIGNEGDGFASIGYGAIAELNFFIDRSGLGWISSVGYLYNNQSSSSMEQDLIDSGLDYTSEVGNYGVITIMTGLSHTGNFSPTLGYMLSGQIIYSSINVGNESYKYSGYLDTLHLSVTDKYEYENASSFGFGIGGGLIINNLIIISAKYLYIGKPELKFSETITIQDLDTREIIKSTYSDNKKQSFSYFLLSVGVTF